MIHVLNFSTALLLDFSILLSQNAFKSSRFSVNSCCHQLSDFGDSALSFFLSDIRSTYTSFDGETPKSVAVCAVPERGIVSFFSPCAIDDLFQPKRSPAFSPSSSILLALIIYQSFSPG